MFCVERGALEHMGDSCFVLSEELWSTWVINVCVERGALEHMSTYICVEQEAMKHI